MDVEIGMDAEMAAVLVSCSPPPTKWGSGIRPAMPVISSRNAQKASPLSSAKRLRTTAELLSLGESWNLNCSWSRSKKALPSVEGKSASTCSKQIRGKEVVDHDMGERGRRLIFGRERAPEVTALVGVKRQIAVVEESFNIA